MTWKTYNFEVRELSISFEEFLKRLENWRGIKYARPNGSETLLDLFRKCVPDIRDSESVEDTMTRRVSAYMTANFATGNDYKYPDTQDEADVQNLLCFVQSGAFYLIVERLEGGVGRSLRDDEKYLLVQFLHELTYEVYADNHPELEEEKEEEQ